MKQILVTLISLFFVGTLAYAQPCYNPKTVGSTWEIECYARKGKLLARWEYKLVDVKKEGSATLYIVDVMGYNGKGENIGKCQITNKSEGNMYYSDMKARMLSSSKGDKVNFSRYGSAFLEYPSMNASAGTSLKEASMEIKAEKDKVMGMVVGFSLVCTDRKVVGIEEKTTPLGTFKCLKIASKAVSNMGLLKMQNKTTDWLAEGIGTVRSELYNKKGKLVAYNVLTSLNVK